MAVYQECRLVKLLTKENGLYVNTPEDTVEVPSKEVVRTSIVVSQETIVESVNNYHLTGLLYEVIPVIP